jgi:hypothetical protein
MVFSRVRPHLLRDLIAGAIVALATVCATESWSQDEAAPDPWKPLEVLLGSWKGTGTGFGGSSTVEHSYEFILQNQFIFMRSKAVFESRDRSDAGEVHEDWGFFSYDRDRDRLVFRQFLSEGYVNTYALEDAAASGDTLTFASERTEGSGGMRARLLYVFPGRDEYEVTLQLAPPGQDFFECRRLHMERVK